MPKARGGKRQGAGRKSILSPEDRLHVGALVEEEIRLAKEQQADAAVRRAFPDIDLEIHRRQLKAFSRRQRKAWRGRLQAEGKTEEEEEDSRLSQLISDLRAEIGERSRGIAGPAATPSGTRRKALAEVAARRGLTIRMVEKCLEEYRKANADTDADC